MARNTYGLDLGSYEIKVYDKKKDTIWKEKNVIAIKEIRRSLLSVMRHMKCMKKHRTRLM